MKSMMPELIAEFFGTLVLVLFGDGVVAMVVLFGSGAPGEVVHGGFTNITLGWGLGVTMGCYIAGRISGAHLNPAVTIALCLNRVDIRRTNSSFGGSLALVIPSILASICRSGFTR